MPEELVRGFSKRTDQIDAELDRLVADGGERTPRLGCSSVKRLPWGRCRLAAEPLGVAGRRRGRCGA
jgi:hypothetical protein